MFSNIKRLSCLSIEKNLSYLGLPIVVICLQSESSNSVSYILCSDRYKNRKNIDKNLIKALENFKTLYRNKIKNNV